ncbi:MAG: hypothetical protein PHE36_05185 [Novosphingobium sp.]|nr:hypothetical protein [Novosphingobium sp.]
MEDELPDDVGARFGRLDDLPEALLRQIPAARIDELEQEIIDVIRHRFSGVASVDEVLVGLYRQSGKIHDRKKVAGKLYRMVNTKPPLLEAVPKKRGIYRIN